MSNIDRVIEQAKMNLRDNTEKFFHIPKEKYTSEEVFKCERENIFIKKWLRVGRAEEVIPNAGDYIDSRILKECLDAPAA